MDVEILAENDFAEDQDIETGSGYHHKQIYVQFFVQYIRLFDIIGVVLSQFYPKIPGQ